MHIKGLLPVFLCFPWIHNKNNIRNGDSSLSNVGCQDDLSYALGWHGKDPILIFWWKHRVKCKDLKPEIKQILITCWWTLNDTCKQTNTDHHSWQITSDSSVIRSPQLTDQSSDQQSWQIRSPQQIISDQFILDFCSNRVNIKHTEYLF